MSISCNSFSIIVLLSISYEKSINSKLLEINLLDSTIISIFLL